jgi:inner membrane protein involved in colicin E2 resistance
MNRSLLFKLGAIALLILLLLIPLLMINGIISDRQLRPTPHRPSDGGAVSQDRA